LSLISTPAAVLAQASVSSSEQLELLSSSLNAIGNLIAASPNLTEADRLTLMTQLVAISGQILALRQGDYKSTYDAYLNPPPAADADKEAAKDAGLTRVKVAYDYESNEAVTEIYYGTTVKKATHTFTELASVSSFEQRMADLRTVLSTKISTDTNIKQADVRRLMQISGRDPLLDKEVATNSATANYLLDKFGQHSIVDEVQILPGNGEGAIAIMSDQDETLLLTLTREVDSDGYYYNPPQYSYSYQFFAPTAFDILSFSSNEDAGPKLIISQVTTEVPTDKIKDHISTLFNDVPFTSKISDFEGKLLKFLTENSAYYETTYTTVDDDDLDCYYASDKLVIDDFIDYLVSGVALQYEDIEDKKHYIAPIFNHDDDDFGSGGCAAKRRMF
jgi:hypothetical protein